MDSILAGLPQHGYVILFAIVFMEAIALPVPAALALAIAGGASASGSLDGVIALAGALTTMILADTLMFLMGRHTGWWLLSLLCRLSFNPESCILRSADSFYRRGRMLLLFAKFVPGINTMAPPMAGSMNMRFGQFFRLDFVGAGLYVGSYFALGYVFSGALSAFAKGYESFGRILGWVVLAAAIVYVGVQVKLWRKARVPRLVPFVRPSEAALSFSADNAVIYDVRSHGYFDKKATRIEGSRRLEPNSLHQFNEDLPMNKKVYLYCTCVRESTSALVAHSLMKKGVQCAVIRGGLRAWKKAGLPVELVPHEEMMQMPVFD